MIELNRHIEILLLSNDCVIVPGLGGFVAHHADARYDAEERLFLPPLRTLGFNPQLRINDHLLVQSYVEAYDISYPEALRRIENEVDELKQYLEKDGEYELTDLGLLRLNDEGNYMFTPCEAGILSPMLYGLSSFGMKPLADLLQSTDTKEQETNALSKPVIKKIEDADGRHPSRNNADGKREHDAIVIRLSWIRNTVAVAVSILLFFLISTPVGNSQLGNDIQQSSFLPVIANSNQAGKQLQENTSFTDSVFAELPAPSAKEANEIDQDAEAAVAEPAEKSSYTIVLASQTPEHHAKTFIDRLSREGIEGVRMMAMANTEKVRVVVGSFSDEEEAHSQLRAYRSSNSNFKEAWVLHVKN